jgi:L-Ala-D/L-Glu epimerase
MNIKVNKCRIPRKTPFVTSQARQDNVNAVIIQINDGEHTGIGETSPRSHINGQTLESSYNDAVDWAYSITDPLKASYNTLPTSTRMGIESALLDLKSQQMGVPVHELMGVSTRDTISYIGFISANITGDKLKRRLSRYNGYDCVRMKLSGNLDDDFERIHQFNEVLPEVKLWVDVNAAWDKSVFDRQNELRDVYMVEQPFPVGLEELNNGLRDTTRVMLDESVQSIVHMHQYKDFMDAVNLKLLKLGDFATVNESCAQAKDSGLQVYCGGTTMTDVGAAYARHLEFSIPSLDFFTTGKPRSSVLSEPISSSLSYDCEPIVYRPTLPGLGIELQNDLVSKYTSKSYERMF